MRASDAEVGFALLDGGLEIRRHFQLIFEPLLKPFPCSCDFVTAQPEIHSGMRREMGSLPFLR
jgi:hypothetical protein